LLLAGLAGIVWVSNAFNDSPPDTADYKKGVYAMIATYLGYCALQGPTSLMVRPHPVVWRVVHGCAMVYLMALMFLLMQGKTEARLWLKVLPLTHASVSCLCFMPLSHAPILLPISLVQKQGLFS
jgi:phosphatidylserine synthase 2